MLRKPRVGDADIPLRWEGDVVGGLRLPGVHGAGDRMIATAEAQPGGALAELSGAEDKQRVVRLLDERRAFRLRGGGRGGGRRSGVSRFTVYNYLQSPERGDAS